VRALTVRQPWAALIVSGVKDIENRTWEPPVGVFGEEILIHAAERRRDDVADVPRVEGDELRGVLLGTVIIVGAIQDSESAWARPDHWHWQLHGAKRLGEPVSCVGSLGFWKVPYAAARAVRLQSEGSCLGQ
jgi:hypothetical protein